MVINYPWRGWSYAGVLLFSTIKSHNIYNSHTSEENDIVDLRDYINHIKDDKLILVNYIKAGTKDKPKEKKGENTKDKKNSNNKSNKVKPKYGKLTTKAKNSKTYHCCKYHGT